jgi:hypothetical protein
VRRLGGRTIRAKAAISAGPPRPLIRTGRTGGDPLAFAQAAEAYTALRTAAAGGPPRPGGQPRAWTPVPGRKNPVARLLLAGGLPIRHGRPVRLAAVMATGSLTWLLLTGRSPLARDRRR